jgi:hypothetical protein
MTDDAGPRDPNTATASHTAPTDVAASDPGLDFERAHFENADDRKRVCNACGRPIADSYYTHGTLTVCPQCQPSYRDKLGQSSFGLALGYGVLAAIAGALVWYGIRAITKYELGIIAIAVGVAVGIAVRKGAGPSTSMLYRVMAVALTYLSVVSTYVPMIAGEISDGATQAAVVITYVVASGLALMIPALMVGDGQIMGVAIIAFGLWEAWQRSAPRAEDQIAGPFQLNPAA